ncbi:hypothetical protein L3C95_30145 [Chitinophaga filiformis]|uniref:hypothetical protein n=1 Tax=Chitinophaga filiformis TaxID=104663 RepID=UPI001F17D1AB|nr:hypothetical protein [Chitinophaga filiformis]MCF6407196.1 hypothetical protein [Chitinophaga filiformis]
MKQKALFTVFLLLSLSCFGIKKYTIPKDEFLQQLSTGSLPPGRVYCYKADGSKVWLFYNKSSVLGIKLKDNTKRDVELHTVTLKNGTLAATVFNVWWWSNKVYTVNIDDIQSFYIERRTTESVMSYVDIDNSRHLVRLKNDSLKNIYANRDELMISWVAKGNSSKDTFRIRENVCYHMDFKDKRQTTYGIVQKITKDSIYISNVYNQEWATVNKTTYEIWGYAIRDIMQLRLLKSGGYGYKAVNADDYEMLVTKTDWNSLRFPYWYAANPTTGELEFYQAWLTARGFLGIREEKGKMYWYEGM